MSIEASNVLVPALARRQMLDGFINVKSGIESAAMRWAQARNHSTLLRALH
jgi:hypothetical protein